MCAASQATLDSYAFQIEILPEPFITFGLNGAQVAPGFVEEFCYDETITFTMFDYWAGDAPFKVCYTALLDGAPYQDDCVTVTNDGDVIFTGVLPVGTYDISIDTLTDANGCMASQATLDLYTGQIIVNPEPTLAITLDGVTPAAVTELCWNGDFVICIEGVDGTPDWTVEWAVTGPSGPFGDIMTGTQECWNFNAADFLPGTYDLTVVSLVDSMMCAASQATLDSYAFQIEIMPEPTMAVTFNGTTPLPVQELCWDDNFEICMTGVVGVPDWAVEWLVTGPSGPFGETTIITTAGECWSYNASIFDAGTYYLTVVSLTDADGMGCAASQATLDSYAFQIEIMPEPTMAVTLNGVTPLAVEEICGDADFTICMNGVLGVPDWEVVWEVTGPMSFGETTIITTAGECWTYDAAIFDAGIYNLKVVSLTDADGMGCAASQATLDSYAFQIEIIPAPIADAGLDLTLCDNVATVPLDGICLNGASSEWTVLGTVGGFIDNSADCQTFYTLGGDDTANGLTFILTVYGDDPPCAGFDDDTLYVTFDPSPTAFAGDPATICEDDPAYCLTADSATNYSALEWNDYLDASHTMPAGGTFVPDNDLHPCYTPASGVSGDIYLVLTAQPDGGCDTPAEGEMILTIVAKPTVDLGADRVLGCDDYDFNAPIPAWKTIVVDPVYGPVGPPQGYGDVQWGSTGTGSFDDATAEIAVYHMSSDDIWGGEFKLWVKVDGIGNCSFQAVDSIAITVPQQLILFDHDLWWGVSSYLDTDLPTVPEVMDPIVKDPIDGTGSRHLVIQINKGGQYFWPEPIPFINQLGDWAPIGYKAKIKDAPACLPIFGDSLADQTFDVNGPFTYVPVLTNVAVDIKDLFEGHIYPYDTAVPKDVLFIYDWSTQHLWTQQSTAGDLQELLPGNAYLLVSTDASLSYTVEFPDFDPNVTFVSAAAGSADVVNNSPWNDAENTALPHILTFANEVLAEMQLGDIIGTFNQNGDCVGMKELFSHDMSFNLIAMGDDPITDAVDGYATGEIMNFKLYRQATNETFDVSLTYDAEFPSYNGLFAIHGFSRVIGMTMSITGLNDIPSNYSVSVYPNPANSLVNIASDYDMKNVTLVNYVGQTIYTAPVTGNSYQINVSNYVTGMYFVRIETTDGSVITKRVTIE